MCAVAAGGALDGDAGAAVLDGGGVLHDAYESGGVFAVGGYLAGGGASADGEHASIVRLADEGGGIEFGGVDSTFCAVDVCLDVAVRHADVAALQGYESCGVAVVVGCDGAHHVEVAYDGRSLSRCTLHVAEGSAVVVGGGVAEGQRVAAAVERAAEVMVVAARHARDGDVVAKLHRLAAEAVVGVVVQQGVAERVPAVGVSDGVLVGAAFRDGSCWAQHQSVERRRVDDGAGVGG